MPVLEIAVAVGPSFVPVTVTRKLAAVVAAEPVAGASSVTSYSTNISRVSPSPKSSKLPSFSVNVAVPSDARVNQGGVAAEVPSIDITTVPADIETASPSMSAAPASRSTISASPSSVASTPLLSTVGASLTGSTVKVISALVTASPSVTE